MGLYGEVKKLKKLTKKFKKNPHLKAHFDRWLEEHFGTSSEDELLGIFQLNPERIKEVNDHYEEIKEKYK